MLSKKQQRSFFLTNFALQNKITVFVLIAIITFFGILSYIQLPKEDFPEIKIPYVFVSTVYPGVAPSDVEVLITKPIEKHLKTIGNVRHISSTSMESFSSVFIEFNPNIDLDTALQKVRDAVNQAKSELPADTNDPRVEEISFDRIPIMMVSFFGEKDLLELRKIGEKYQDKIESLEGVLDVQLIGGLDREIKVLVDGDKLAHYNLSFNDVTRSIAGENINVPGGTIEIGEKNFLVRIPQEFDSVEELSGVVIKSTKGDLIYLKDVARILNGFQKQKTKSRYNLQNSVSLLVMKKSGENIVALSDRINALLKNSNGTIPPGVDVAVLGDRADNIRDIVTELTNTIITGMLLVVFILLFFLGKRNALIVGGAIPLSIFLSLTILQFMGIRLNMVVLFSLILAIGMLVDNGIVIVESIFRHKDAGKSANEAAKDGTAEVALPVITSTLTTLAAFVPILFWPGIMGEFIKYLPLTLIVVFLSSLFVALCIIPVLSAVFLNIVTKKKKKSLKEKEEKAILKGYKKLLISVISAVEINKPTFKWKFGTAFWFLGSLFLTMVVMGKAKTGIDYALSLSVQGTLIKFLDVYGLVLLLGIIGLGFLSFVLWTVGKPRKAKSNFVKLFVTVYLLVLSAISIPFLDAIGNFDVPIGMVRLLAGIILLLPILFIFRGLDKYSNVSINRRILIYSFIILLLISFNMIGKLDSVLFPKTTPEGFKISIKLADGYALEKTDEIVSKVERKVASLSSEGYPIVKQFVTNVGTQASGFFSLDNSNYAEISIDFYSQEKREQLAKKEYLLKNQIDPYEVMDYMRKELKNISGAKITIGENQSGPHVGKDVALEISGDDFEVLRVLRDKSRKIIENIEGVVNVQDNFKEGGTEIRVRIDRDKAAVLGLNPIMIAATIRTAINGEKATVYREDEEEIDVIVSLQKKQVNDLGYLKNLAIKNRDGKEVRLNQVASLTMSRGIAAVNRMDFKRVILVEGDISKQSGKTPQAVTMEIERKIQEEGVVFPAGYTFKFTGQQESSAESTAFLGKALWIALALIAIILVTQFNSLILPGIIMFSVALSFIGVVLGLYLAPLFFRLEPELAKFVVLITGVGVLSLAGVVVNNAIVLLDYIQQLRGQGLTKVEAIMEAGVVRFRPVMLTAITTIVGLLPMSTGISLDFTKRIFLVVPTLIINAPSSEFWSPMSDAVIFGLAVATMLTLIMVPVLYYILDGLHFNVRLNLVKTGKGFTRVFRKFMGS